MNEQNSIDKLDEFLEKAKNGDPVAEGEIYRRVYPMLVGYFRKQLNHQHDPELLASECLAAFFKNIQDVKSPSAYINTARVRHLINALKSRWLRKGKITISIDKELPNCEGQTMQDYIPSNSPSSLDGLIKQEWQIDITDAIDALPAKYGEALRLRTMGFSYKEISGLLLIKEKRVGTVIYRARQMLLKNPKVKRHYDELQAG